MSRLFLLAGVVSVLLGILSITDTADIKSGNLSTWGYFLLFWGIAVIMLLLKEQENSTLVKVLSIIGIMLHGSVALYGVVFPEGIEGTAPESGFSGSFLSSMFVTIVCILIFGCKKIR
jgi:uncharacterized membrane protein HdeD (DUF308 family)